MQTETLALEALALRQAAPHGDLFLLLDDISGYQPREQRLVANKHLSQADPFMKGHFPGYPLFPGVLIIETLAQACRLLMNLDHLVGRGIPLKALQDALLAEGLPRGFLLESRLKHSGMVRPGDTLRLEAQIVAREGDQYTFRVTASVEATEVGRGKLTLLRSLTPSNRCLEVKP